MNDHYAQIKLELELTKQELEERVNRSCSIDRENFQSVAAVYEREKDLRLDQHIQDELEDVNRALLKMEFGIYGFCEETGKEIPYEQLRVLPTARTLSEIEAILHFPYLFEYNEQLLIR